MPSNEEESAAVVLRSRLQGRSNNKQDIRLRATAR
jgi:hypothetical protein